MILFIVLDSKLVSKETKEHFMVHRTKEHEKLQTNLQITITIQANRKNKNLSKEILGPTTPQGDISHGDVVPFDNSLTHLHTHELEAFTHFAIFRYVQFQLNKDFLPICIVALLNP
jgi:DNA polymerase IIIc chi subunit